jgi:hypothetical protein
VHDDDGAADRPDRIRDAGRRSAADLEDDDAHVR